jgi:hypothetical protein
MVEKKWRKSEESERASKTEEEEDKRKGKSYLPLAFTLRLKKIAHIVD